MAMTDRSADKQQKKKKKKKKNCPPPPPWRRHWLKAREYTLFSHLIWVTSMKFFIF